MIMNELPALSLSGYDIENTAGRYITFNIDNLSKLIILFISIIHFLDIYYIHLFILKQEELKIIIPIFLSPLDVHMVLYYLITFFYSFYSGEYLE